MSISKLSKPFNLLPEIKKFLEKMDSNNEIHKFVKFLAFKSTQIIVQSRLGGLIYTKCNNTGTDWVSEDGFREDKLIEGHDNRKINKESIVRLRIQIRCLKI